MPRTKQFSETAALDTATAVFTRHGYDGTSMAMLTDAIGVGKQSLYDAFGDKRQLLSSCLAHAVQQFKPAAALMNPKLDGRSAITRFFHLLLEDCANPDDAGCLGSNLLLEKGLSDPDIQTEAVHYWSRSELALEQTLARGKSDGSIITATSSKTLAVALMNWMSGLRVSKRANASVKQLKITTELFLNALLDAK
jgi:TetR/AcrR family transcriptional regulator, transcriptional repressor for nem operon